jgi:hypothetical protein
MIAIGTGLKTEFLGTVKISYGCVLCIVAFSLAAVLCPVDRPMCYLHYKCQYFRFFCLLHVDGLIDLYFIPSVTSCSVSCIVLRHLYISNMDNLLKKEFLLIWVKLLNKIHNWMKSCFM